MARVQILVVLLAWWAFGPLMPTRAESTESTPPAEQAPTEATPAAPVPALGSPPPSNPAEQIAQLSASIAEDTKRLEALRIEVETARSEVDQANNEFRTIDQQHRELSEQLAERQQKELPTEEIAEDLEALTRSRALADERRELAATSLKTFNEQIATLETKLRQSDQALKRLLGEQPKPAPTPETPEPATAPAEPAPPSAPAAAEEPEAPAAEPAASIPGLPNLEEMAGAAGKELAVRPTFGPNPNDPKLKKAREAAQTSADLLEQAESEVVELTERLRTLDDQIRNEEQVLETARRTIDNAEASGTELARDYQDKLFGGANGGELRELQGRIRENERRLLQARAESRQHSDEIIRLQAERSEIASQLQLARWRAETARSQFSEAESTLKRMENPFAPENLINWTLRHGVNIVAIIVGMLLLRWGSRLISRRIVSLMSQRGQRGTTAEKEHRISTLVGVFDNAASVAVVVGGILMIFQELGVPVGPLLGGAAVLGLAIAFGAQNLIRDFFYGFVILLENQYKLNDVIRIQGIAGQVEAITLRVTVLRDLEGCVHFIPNGEITKVTNMTHGWSRALFEVGVAYKENVDRVMDVIMQVGKELRQDPQYRMLILEDPTMLGVDAFADSAVVIKFFIKTRPLQQWTVKRELLRRLKNTFDELGISIPFPHRTIYHVHDEGHSHLAHEPHLSGGDEIIVAGRAMPDAAGGR
ncbi:mechanosensitive ion channel domain-containing protein [Tautonia marina]|uniref:mechanosensitive ion channel domain-containing protein n=1 Tax=Tautonia marina TaxID=2653855 RepID=UPI001260CD9F|nr:mechanosensitive ion channel family protein [Tautonia marina]